MTRGQTGKGGLAGLAGALLVVCAPIAVAQAPDTVVWGRVVNALNGTPISGALVTVRGQGTAAPRTQLTDAQGGFLFRGASPNARITVTRSGYAQGLAWDPAIGQPSAPSPVDIAPNSSEPLIVRLWPLAEIAGSVFDDGNRPVVGVRVHAEPTPRYPGMRQRPLSTTTDDRGQYRLSNVPPGTYLVSARLPAAVTIPNQMATSLESTPSPESAAMRDRIPVFEVDGWLLQVPPADRFAGPLLAGSADAPMVARPVYYPNARDPAAAQVLSLRPGRTLDGVNLVLPVEPGYRIRGTVRVDGRPQPGLQVAALLGGANDTDSSPAVIVASATTGRDGGFVLVGLPSGRYRVVALPARPVGPMTPRDILWGEALVDVATGHVQDVVLDAGPLPPFEAIVSWTGQTTDPAMVHRVSIAMEGEPDGLRAGPAMMRFSPAPDGRMDLGQLAPGEYAMQVIPPPGSVVQSITVNDTPLAGRTLHRPSRAPAVVRIILTSTPGSAAIAVRRSRIASNASNSVVALFPAERNTWNHAVHDIDRFKLALVDASGRAVFTGLVPGDYLAAAIDTDRPGLVWRDRRMLERLALDASAVRITANGQASAVVTAVSE